MNAKVKQRWLALFRKSESGFPGLLLEDRFEDWEKLRNPATIAGLDFWHALTNYYAGDPLHIAASFLKRSKAICDRIGQQKKWESALCKNAAAVIRGETYRIKAYLHVFEAGCFDFDCLQQASLDYEHWCLVDLKGSWKDDLVQDMYMTAILLALFADDKIRARQLLERKKAYKYHLDSLEILKTAIYSADVTPWLKSGPSFQAFTTLFNNFRDPQYRPLACTEVTMRRLELGFIREKYYESKTGKLDWRHVIEMISE